jgi:citrate synthase
MDSPKLQPIRRVDVMTQVPSSSGLEGVVAAQTLLSSVDGNAGELLLCGYPVEEIAPQARFEQVVALFLDGAPPSSARTAELAVQLRSLRQAHPATLELLDAAAAARVAPMDALRLAAATLPLERDLEPSIISTALRSIALYPVLIAHHWRRFTGLAPIAPHRDLDHAANFLWMLNGDAPAPSRVRGLETYWNTVVDHGMNASTFTARVVVSTAAPCDAALVAALGALQGPLHGGAPGPALEMVFEIGTADRAEDYLRAKIERGERLMGFGHRVYRVRDPRAEVLASAAAQLANSGENRALYALARAVEECALRLLAQHKPERRLATNVEFYTALLLHLIDLPQELFTPLFAASRVVGWSAHCLEQQRCGRLIRPQSEFVGARRRWAGSPTPHPVSTT